MSKEYQDPENDLKSKKNVESDKDLSDLEERKSVFADSNKKKMIGLSVVAGIAFLIYMYFFFGKSEEEKQKELEANKMKGKTVQTYNKNLDPLSSKNDSVEVSANNKNVNNKLPNKNANSIPSVATTIEDANNNVLQNTNGNNDINTSESKGDMPIAPSIDILDIDLDMPDAPKNIALPNLPKPKKIEKSIDIQKNTEVKKEIEVTKGDNTSPNSLTEPIVNVVAPPGGNKGQKSKAPLSSSELKKQARGNAMVLFSKGKGRTNDDSDGLDQYDQLKKAGVLSSDGDPGEDDEVGRTSDQATATFLGDMRYIIAQGKIIDAVLETGINTDLEGILRAVVSRDVYAEMGATVLMPAGTRLIGEYSTNISYTQSRVDVIWTRAILPNGLDFDLDNAKGTDSLGRAGIRGKVDNKMASIFANAFMLSSLKIASGILLEKIVGDQNVITNENASGDVTTTSSVSAQLATEAITDLTGVAQDYIERYTPTGASILVPQGTRIKVFVYKDLVFPRIIYSKELRNVMN